MSPKIGISQVGEQQDKSSSEADEERNKPKRAETTKSVGEEGGEASYQAEDFYSKPLSN